MKLSMLLSLILLPLLVSGCTASDWVDVAGGVMQGRDDYNKSQRATRLKQANTAAERIKRERCVERCT